MIAKNEITGKELRSKPVNDLYRQNWEIIFNNPSLTQNHVKEKEKEKQAKSNDNKEN